MKLHILKLNLEYAEAKYNGIKSFEIRENDRDFKCGDLIKYVINGCDELDLFNFFETHIFRINFITNYNQKEDYIVYNEKCIYIGDYND